MLSRPQTSDRGSFSVSLSAIWLLLGEVRWRKLFMSVRAVTQEKKKVWWRILCINIRVFSVFVSGEQQGDFLFHKVHWDQWDRDRLDNRGTWVSEEKESAAFTLDKNLRAPSTGFVVKRSSCLRIARLPGIFDSSLMSSGGNREKTGFHRFSLYSTHKDNKPDISTTVLELYIPA